MAAKEISEKKDNAKKKTNKNAIQKFAAFFVRMGKGFKTFFVSLKAELKRVIWPDKKRLVQSTATVLAICIFAAVILFVVDSLLSTVLNGVGFYSPKADVPAITETTAAPDAAPTSGGA